MDSTQDQVTEAAQALSELGASKGGRARAAKLSREERQEIARHAAQKRWGVGLPRVTHPGDLKIGDMILQCAVIEGGTRLFTQRGIFVALGRHKNPSRGQASIDNRPGFLSASNLEPFISDELRRSWVPIPFHSQGGYKGNMAFGYRAEILPLICEVFVDARDAGKLHKGQLHIAEKCKILMRGFSRVGIIALVDEATGYQEERAKDELIKILEAYVIPELQRWTKKFPDEFFKQMYRILDWEYKPGTAKRSPYVGKLINKYIYEQLPPGVMTELRRLNPVTESGYRRHKHFQFLTANTGNEHLDKQISAVMMLMRISDNRGEFERNFERAFEKEQTRLPLTIDVNGKTVSV